MKRFIAILSLIIISFSSFAKEKTNPDVLTVFYHTFTKAANVNWMEVNGLLRIGFTMDGREHFAYYDESKLIVVAKRIEKEELPEKIKMQLENYSNYAVSDAYEMQTDGNKEYCISLDNHYKHIVLKGSKKLIAVLKNGK